VCVADEEQENIAIGGVECGGVLAEVDVRVECMVLQSSTPGTFQRVSPMPLPAMFKNAETSSWSQMRP
jgi:hypothetical protein